MIFLQKNRVISDSDCSGKHQSLLVFCCFLLILLVGFVVRIEDLRDWQAHPEKAFFQEEPLLITYDGYYYLSLARDLVEGTYTPVNSLRTVPDSPSRPVPPPLLSVLAAAVAGITNISLNWIGCVLPTVCGITLAFPLYFLGRVYGGPVMGLTAALIGLLSNNLVYRSSLGWFDTDCLNVTFAMLAAWCFLRFGLEKGLNRYVYFIAGIVTYILFLWWWNTTPEAVTAIAMLPLAIALIVFYRPRGREAVVFVCSVAAVVLLIFSWQGFDLLLQIKDALFSQFAYISKQETSYFPNVGQLVSEQGKSYLLEIVASTTDSYPTFFLSVVGLLLLVFRYPGKSLFLLAPCILSCFSLLFAKRFIIFLAPMTALGLGFLVSEAWRLRTRYRVLTGAVPIFVILTAAITLKTDMGQTYWPKIDPALVAGMDQIRKNTPEDAVVWAWWDLGYPMIYWSKRATITDGTFHGGERSVYDAVPFAVSDFRLAANFIRFYVARGPKGFQAFYKAVGNDPAGGFAYIKKILAAGPEQGRDILAGISLAPVDGRVGVQDWLAFFFPPSTRPVYLFLDYTMTRTSYWWYWLGTWDIAKHDGTHPRSRSFFQVRVRRDYTEAGNRHDLYADLAAGKVTTPEQIVPLKSAQIYNEKGLLHARHYSCTENNFLDVYAPGGLAVLQNSVLVGSLFNRFFLRHENSRYFQPVQRETPVFQVYRVAADTGR
jgi:dolichyl-diphosphooligosaccharide--protein glycosyltransferase